MDDITLLADLYPREPHPQSLSGLGFRMWGPTVARKSGSQDPTLRHDASFASKHGVQFAQAR